MLSKFNTFSKRNYLNFFAKFLHLFKLNFIQIYNIFLLVVLWTNEALPWCSFITSNNTFPSFDILITNATSVNYSKIIFLFLGGFMIAIATQK